MYQVVCLCATCFTEQSLNNSLCPYPSPLKKKSETPQIIFYPLNESYPSRFQPVEQISLQHKGKEITPSLNVFGNQRVNSFEKPPRPVSRSLAGLLQQSLKLASFLATLALQGSSLGSIPEHPVIHTQLSFKCLKTALRSSRSLFLWLNISISVAPGVNSLFLSLNNV